MQADKQFLIDELLARLESSPYLFVADYTGLQVKHFAELRKRLKAVGAKARVLKNTLVKRTLKAAGLPELAEVLVGQTMIVTGEGDLFRASSRRLFQVECYIATNIGPASHPAATGTTSKEILEDSSAEHVAERFEDIADIAKTARLSLDAGMSELVVPRSLLLVADHLVCFSTLLELRDCFLIVGVAIRVILDR